MLSVDDPTIGSFSVHSAGTARVTVVLAGASAGATVVVSAMCDREIALTRRPPPRLHR